MFKDIKSALEFLKNLDFIIMPKQFTYFNHCTHYKPSENWDELPIEEFTIRKEMSFLERRRRIIEGLDKGSVEEIDVTYTPSIDSKPFIIRVIMPKQNLSKQDLIDLDIDDEYYKKLRLEHNGLMGGYSHPKLASGEKIHIFACSTVDEVSKKTIDIFYGVREQDVLRYANTVYNELTKKSSYDEPIMPKSKNDRDFEFEHRTYSIKKSKDFSRYIRKDHGEYLQLSDFENEYFESLKKNSESKKIR